MEGSNFEPQCKKNKTTTNQVHGQRDQRFTGQPDGFNTRAITEERHRNRRSSVVIIEEEKEKTRLKGFKKTKIKKQQGLKILG